jgi:hypothetical protein
MRRKNSILLYVLLILILILILFIAYNPYYSFENFQNNLERKTAFIIEPRKHKALEYVLENFLENLNSSWDFIIFHGNLNKEYIENIINNKLNKYRERIRLISLNVDNINNGVEYSRILTNKEFYRYIPNEIFLIFQTDTLINPKYKNKINDFLIYDYVGAPWQHTNEVGNGGLSLRKKSKMLEIIENCPYVNNDNNVNYVEDVYFSKKCKNIDIYKPDFNTAKEFASETTWNPTSFGIHKVWQYFDISKIKKDFPEVENLSKLQGAE